MNNTPLSERKITVVKAKVVNDPKNENRNRTLRTAAYCRVSTDSREQETSFESQVKYYTDMINDKEDWKLVDIYADPAVSGTSRRNRLQFDKMLYDCIHGKVDQIITKSMSRFARNQLDTLACIRLLNGLHPPVKVIFEDDHICSNDLSSEIIVSVFSMVAEQESAKKSTGVKWGFERRKEQGHYLTPVRFLLGYGKTEAARVDDREIYIEDDEQAIIRVIYLMFLAGYRVSEIAYELTKYGAPTGKGNIIWNSSSVLGILRNERYAGDVRTNKTYCESFRTHKIIQNKGEKDYVYEQDHHPSIVSHEEYEMAQKLIASHKFGYDPWVNGTYCLKIIKNGLLKGFIPINVHWAGSSLQEYIDLCKTVQTTAEMLEGKRIRCFPGFQVVRTQDLGHSRRGALKISPKSISLSMFSKDLLPDIDFIEILFNPVEKMLAIRPTVENAPGAVRWRRWDDISKKYVPCPIGSAAFTPLLYELMGWPQLWNTSFLAMTYVKKQERVLFFDLKQTEINALPYFKPKPKKEKKSNDAYYDIEVMIAQQIELMHNKQEGHIVVEEETEVEELPTPKRKKLHPSEWKDTFGQESGVAEMGYRQYQFKHQKEWDIKNTGETVEGFDLQVPVSEQDIEQAKEQLNFTDETVERRKKWHEKG